MVGIKETPMDSRNYNITMVDQWEESKTPIYKNYGSSAAASVTDNKGRTITVRDLIAELEKAKPDAPVVIKDKNGLKVGAYISVQDMGEAVFLTGNDLEYPDPKKIEDYVWLIDYEIGVAMSYAQYLKKLCNNEPV